MRSGTSILLRSCACTRAHFTDYRHLSRPFQCVGDPIREKSSQGRTSSAPLFVVVVGQTSYFQSSFCSLVVMRDGDALTGPSADGSGGFRGPSFELSANHPKVEKINNSINTLYFTTSHDNLMKLFCCNDLKTKSNLILLLAVGVNRDKNRKRFGFSCEILNHLN